jgi:hypothetical protein
VRTLLGRGQVRPAPPDVVANKCVMGLGETDASHIHKRQAIILFDRIYGLETAIIKVNIAGLC